MKLLDFFFVVLRRNSGILGGKEIDMVENLDGEGFGNGNWEWCIMDLGVCCWDMCFFKLVVDGVLK